MAEAVISGIAQGVEGGLQYELKAPLNTKAEDILSADAVILLTSENFGYMSGALKDLFDRTYYLCIDHTEGLPYALIVRAGNDGVGAKTSVERIVSGLKWRQVQETLICRGEFTADFIESCHMTGMTLCVGLETGIF